VKIEVRTFSARIGIGIPTYSTYMYTRASTDLIIGGHDVHLNSTSDMPYVGSRLIVIVNPDCTTFISITVVAIFSKPKPKPKPNPTLVSLNVVPAQQRISAVRAKAARWDSNNRGFPRACAERQTSMSPARRGETP
jgi:hypothetical protein